MSVRAERSARESGRGVEARVLAAALAALALACGGGGPVPVPPGPPRAPAASQDWWNGAVVYQVFVRSFRDSDGDGIGDLRGLTERLDHLNDGSDETTSDLAVDAIWLMPIHPSPSSHGYDVTDLDGVNPQYGTMADLDALLAAAHARGLRVVLDWIPNHTSTRHPWFVEAASSATAPRRGFYVWSATNPGWTQPFGPDPAWHPASTGTGWYYGAFFSGMPDLDWRNPAVEAELTDAARRWLARGVDGFRIDAVRYLVENGRGAQQDQPETLAALGRFAAAVREARPGAFVVGEAWTDTRGIAPYLAGLPATFDFPLAEATLQAVQSRQAAPLVAALDAVAVTYPPGSADAPFLSNHDQDRVATRLAGDAAGLRLAASILLAAQGTPFVYYGEEVGLANGAGAGDERRRTPMPWDATPGGGFTAGTPWYPFAGGRAAANVASQAEEPGSLLSRYRTLVRVRKASPALARGGTARLGTASPAVLALLREAEGERVLVVHNLGQGRATETFSVAGAGVAPLFVDPGASAGPAAAGGFTVTLPGRASAVWRVE
jgi:glycosidase